MYYFGYKGQILGDGKGLIKKNERTKIKEGDLVTVKVLREKAEILWYINWR